MAEYEDKAAAAATFAKLGKLPGLVQPAEVDRLRTVLAAAANGERFIIQGNGPDAPLCPETQWKAEGYEDLESCRADNRTTRLAVFSR